jgi:hypothetical protein
MGSACSEIGEVTEAGILNFLHARVSWKHQFLRMSWCSVVVRSYTRAYTEPAYFEQVKAS